MHILPHRVVYAVITHIILAPIQVPEIMKKIICSILPTVLYFILHVIPNTALQAQCNTLDPALLRVTNLTKNKMKLSSIAGGYVEYHWRWKRTNAEVFNVATTTVPEITIDVNPTRQYEFQLQIKCPGGSQSGYSRSKLFTTDCETISGPIEYIRQSGGVWEIELNTSGAYDGYISYCGRFKEGSVLFVPNHRDWCEEQSHMVWPIGGTAEIIPDVQFRMQCPDESWSEWSSDYTLNVTCEAPRTNQVSAHLISNDDLRVQCDKDASIYQFRIRETGTSIWRTSELIVSANFTTFNNVDQHKQYEIQCRLLCGSQYTEFSGSLIYIGSDVCPAPVLSEYRISAITSNSAKLEDRSSNEDVARWEFRWRSGGVWQTQRTNEPFLVVHNLDPATQYESGFRRTCNNDVVSNWSPEMAYFNTKSICPAPFGSVEITNTNFTSARLNIADDTYKMYQFRYRRQNQSRWLTTIESSRSEQRIDSLREGETYECQGRGQCDDGKWSEWAAGPDFTTPACVQPITGEIGVENVTNHTAELQYRDFIDQSIQWRYKRADQSDWTELDPITDAIEFLDGLLEGRDYLFACRLSCIDANSEEQWSDWCTTQRFSTNCNGAISRIRSITTTSMTVIAENGYDEYEFRYQVQGRANWTSTPVSPNNSVDLIDLRPGTTYDINVRITCNGSRGPWSAISSETTLVASFNATAPPHPSFLTTEAIDEQLVSLECQLGGQQAYQFRVREEGTTNWTELPESFSETDTVKAIWKDVCTIGVSTECNLYEFQCRVLAADSLLSGSTRSNKWTDWSSSAYFNPMRPKQGNCTGPPIRKLVALSIDQQSATLYCDVSGRQAYDFRYRATGDTVWIALPATMLQGHFIKNLFAGKLYEFQCRMSCGTGTTTWSRNKYFKTRSITGCDAPNYNNLYVRDINVHEARINCSIKGVLGFDWRYRKNDSTKWFTLPAGSDNYYYIHKLASQTAYEFQSRVSCSDSSISAWSVSYPFYTLQECPAASSSELKIARISDTTAVVQYSQRGTQDYAIRYRSTGTDLWYQIAPTRDSSLEIKGLSKNGRYDFQVIHLCFQSNSTWSRPVSYIHSGVTAIRENTNLINWSLYPNPARDQVFLDLREYSGSVNIRIVNAVGVCILRRQDSGGSTITLPITFSPGVYYCWLEYGAGTQTIKKLVIQ